MIKVVISKKSRVLALALIPLMLLIGINIFIGFNLGAEYASANVINIQLSEQSSYSEVSNVFRELKTYSKFEAFENNSFKAYYQNVTLDELNQMKDDLGSKLGTINSFEVLSYKPTTLVMISDRIFYGIYAVTLIYLAYLAYILRKSGITRDRLIGILVTDVVALVFQFAMTAGLVNLLGLSSYKLSPSIVTFCLGILMLSVLPNILITHNLSENYRSDIIGGWEDSAKNFIASKLKFLVLTGIGFLLFASIWLGLLVILPISIIVFIYSLSLFVYAKPLILEWILNGIKSNRFISKNKLLRKEW